MHSASPNTSQMSFWDRTAPRYARKPIADPEAYEQKLSRVTALLRPTDRVLEIGCGTGGTALRLAPHAASVTGTDISGAMVALAQAKIGPSNAGNVRFAQAHALAPQKDAPFDVICAFSLLHLVDDLPATIAHIYDQLEPGGTFVSKTVCLGDGPWAIRALVAGLTLIEVAPKVLVLDRHDLIQQFTRAGFEITQTAYFNKGRTNPFIVARKPR